MYLIIANPVAAKGRSLKKLDEVKKYLDEKGIQYEVVYTEYPRHATKIAAEYLNKGQKYFLSLGGDGTLVEIAKALIGTDGVLGVIPAGTGNDFIKALGVPSTIESALENILKGNVKRIDVGKANGEYFINITGTGFDVNVLENVEKVKKTLTGSFAYIIGLLMALFGYKGNTLTITANGQTTTKKAMIVAVANGIAYGGGMYVAPKAILDDGLFHVTFADMPRRIKILFMLPKFISGNHEKVKEIHSFTCEKIRIESDEPLKINIDGDITGQTPIDIEIVKKALNVFAPAE